jgi:hypothetical protein
MKVDTPSPLSPADISHRRQFEQFVLDDAAPWHREHLGRLYRLWNEWNEKFFVGAMLAPYIVLSPPSSTRAEGDCSPFSGFGGRSQVRIRPSLLTGTHPRICYRADPNGRFLYVADVLLHEMIHQWQQEITGIRETSYHGHGPSFRDKCNEIGRELGLPPVGTKTRGGVLPFPNCAHWPSNVRPAGYYLGAVAEPREILAEVVALADLPSLDQPRTKCVSRVSRAAKIAEILLRVLGPAEIVELIALLENRPPKNRLGPYVSQA